MSLTEWRYGQFCAKVPPLHKPARSQEANAKKRRRLASVGMTVTRGASHVGRQFFVACYCLEHRIVQGSGGECRFTDEIFFNN